MASRICAHCGHSHSMEGGKLCDKHGHFFCKGCVYSGIIFISTLKYCPIDNSTLR